MYKINLTEEVASTIQKEFIKKTSNRTLPMPFASKGYELKTFEVWGELFSRLEKDPYCYPEIKDGIFMITETYLHQLIYTVKDDQVYIYKVIPWGAK